MLLNKNVERCGTVVNHQTREREVAGSIPVSTTCRVSLKRTLYPHCLVLVSTREDPPRMHAKAYGSIHRKKEHFLV